MFVLAAGYGPCSDGGLHHSALDKLGLGSKKRQHLFDRALKPMGITPEEPLRWSGVVEIDTRTQLIPKLADLNTLRGEFEVIHVHDQEGLILWMPVHAVP